MPAINSSFLALRKGIKKHPSPYEGTGVGPRYHPSFPMINGLRSYLSVAAWIETLSRLYNGVIRLALLSRNGRDHQAGRSRASLRLFYHRLAPTAGSLMQDTANTPAQRGLQGGMVTASQSYVNGFFAIDTGAFTKGEAASTTPKTRATWRSQ